MANRRAVVRKNIRFARRAKADLKAYDSLIASPHDFGEITDAVEEPLVLPANGRFAISCSEALSAGDVEVTIGAHRVFSHPDLEADEIFKGKVGEKGQAVNISIADGAEGDLSLYLIDEFGRPLLIAEGTLGAADVGGQTYLFILGSGKRQVHRMSLTDPLDIATATLDSGQEKFLGAYDRVFGAIFCKADGSRFYILGSDQDSVRQFDMGTPFDHTDMDEAGEFYVGTQTTATNSVTGLFFSDDGTKMYIGVFNNAMIYQYTLGTAWDITTASYGGVSFNPSAQVSASTYGPFFKPDGTKMFIKTSTTMWAYTLSTPWDLSSATYASETKAITGTSFIFTSDGLHLLTGADTYTLSGAWDITGAVVDGGVSKLYVGTGSINSICWGDTQDLIFIGDVAAGIHRMSLYHAGQIAFPRKTSASIAAQNTSQVGLFVKEDGTKLYMIGVSGSDGVWQYSMSTPFDASTLSYDTKTVNTSAQDNSSSGICFKDDGTKMYIIGGNNRVYQYTLSTPWDVSTATYDTVSFLYSGTLTSAVGIIFSDDGTKMYLNTTSIFYQFTLGTPWDVSTASYASKSITTNGGIFPSLGSGAKMGQFKADGTLFMWTASQGPFIAQLSTPWDISTATAVTGEQAITSISSNGAFITRGGEYTYGVNSTTDLVISQRFATPWSVMAGTYDGVGLVVANEDMSPGAVVFSADGTKAYMIGATNDRIYEYDLDTPYDLTAMEYNGNSLSVAAQETTGRGLALSAAGNILYLVGASSAVQIYTMSTPLDITSATLTGSFSLSAIPNPTNMTGITLSPDGTKMFIVNSQNGFVFRFNLGTPWDATTATLNSYFSAGGTESGCQGLFFKPDGTRMYQLGDSNKDTIQEFKLTTPWDLSTAVFNNRAAYVGAQDGTMKGVFFKPDGTKAFLIGATNDTVYQYTLGTAWDLHTMTYSSVSLLVSAQDNNNQDIFFKDDGTKMYLIGDQGDAVDQYTLATPWDLSTATYDTVTFSVTSQQATPSGIIFDPTGTTMLVCGSGNSGRVSQYTLSTPWSMASAAYASKFLATTTQDLLPVQIAFNNDGTKLYVYGNTNKAVYQYTLPTPYDLTSASYDSISKSNNEQANSPQGVAFNAAGTMMLIYGNQTNNTDVYQYDLSTPWDMSSATFAGEIDVSALEGAATDIFFVET